MTVRDYLNSDFGVLGYYPMFFGLGGHDWYCEDSAGRQYGNVFTISKEV